MAAAASDRQANRDDTDLIENDMIHDEDDLDDDELQQMLQDNEADAGAMTDTANTDWYGPCGLTSKACIVRHAHVATMSRLCQESHLPYKTATCTGQTRSLILSQPCMTVQHYLSCLAFCPDDVPAVKQASSYSCHLSVQPHDTVKRISDGVTAGVPKACWSRNKCCSKMTCKS